MSSELSNNILIALILFFGLFVFSGLLKYFGIREGMTGKNATNIVNGNKINTGPTYKSF